MNSELYNFVIHDNSNNNNIIYGSNYHSLMLSERQQQQQQSFNDSYTALISEEAEKLYNKLMTELTNRVISAVRATSLPSLTNNNEQTLTHKNDRY